MGRGVLCAALALGLAAAADNHWAVIIAGSGGYGNYRHQADAGHAYHLVRSKGVPEDHIITMIADDIANDPENPFPGRVYNRKDPGAVDVYAGLKMSYTGKSVNASNFLAVLRGNATGVAGGSGEVLRSDAKSDVFVAYFDHGASGILGMPSGPFLYASDLNDTLNYMHEQGLYGQLTLYIEACESGSMFEGILSPNMSIYATTASNADESSWGWYCPPDDVVNGTELNTCLGDLYSINWMQNADAPSDSQETLEQQFQIVKNLTVLSHVSRYGDRSFTNESIYVFEGDRDPSASLSRRLRREPTPAAPRTVVAPGASNAWDARRASFKSLQRRVEKAGSSNSLLAESLRQQLEDELQRNDRFERAFTTLATTHLQSSLEEALGRRFELPHERAWSCYKSVNDAMHVDGWACGAYTDVAMVYARIVGHLCADNDGDVWGVRKMIAEACSA